MAKYSESFKLKIVREYQEGHSGYITLASKHGMPSSTPIKNWVKLYGKFGIEGLKKKDQKRSYSVQFKLDVLSFMKRTGFSRMDTTLHFGITSPSLITAWKKAFNEDGAEAFGKLKGRPPMSDKAKNKKKETNEKELTHEQRLERENELVRLEVEYIKKLQAFQMDPESYLEKHKQRYHSNSKKLTD